MCLQALMSLEYGSDIETACRFAYTHDREDDEGKTLASNRSCMVFKLKKRN